MLDVRSELLKLLQDKQYSPSTEFKEFESRLKFLLSKWFNNGLLRLVEISPAHSDAFLENVKEKGVVLFICCLISFGI